MSKKTSCIFCEAALIAATSPPLNAADRPRRRQARRFRAPERTRASTAGRIGPIAMAAVAAAPPRGTRGRAGRDGEGAGKSSSPVEFRRSPSRAAVLTVGPGCATGCAGEPPCLLTKGRRARPFLRGRNGRAAKAPSGGDGRRAARRHVAVRAGEPLLADGLRHVRLLLLSMPLRRPPTAARRCSPARPICARRSARPIFPTSASGRTREGANPALDLARDAADLGARRAARRRERQLRPHPFQRPPARGGAGRPRDAGRRLPSRRASARDEIGRGDRLRARSGAAFRSCRPRGDRADRGGSRRGRNSRRDAWRDFRRRRRLSRQRIHHRLRRRRACCADTRAGGAGSTPTTN